MAIRFYSIGERNADRKKELSEMLSVSVRSITTWVADLDQAEREARKEKIKDLYLKAYTAEEIGEVIGSVDVVKKELPCLSEDVLKSTKVQFSEEGWQPPIYNIWSFAKKTNETSHFGNTEQRITDNLLHLYTNPLDIVIDPFGGGGGCPDTHRQRSNHASPSTLLKGLGIRTNRLSTPLFLAR